MADLEKLLLTQPSVSDLVEVITRQRADLERLERQLETYQRLYGCLAAEYYTEV